MFTKIICTIGPASEKKEVLAEMVKSGMRVARLNFSHGSYSEHKKIMQTVRAISKDAKIPLGIMQDLQGPKIRIGDLKKTIKVKKGETIKLGKGGIPTQFDLSKIVAVGQDVLIDDGLIRLQATKIGKGFIECKVDIGGSIIAHKGINIPQAKTNFSVFTTKDKKDLAFGLKNNVDFVAMSFVRTGKDIQEVKNFIKSKLRKDRQAPWVIAKIEKTQAMKNIDWIISAADAIMVARGDLGIEAPEELVPEYQKTIIHKCLHAGKPVIVATQMLDSMIRNPKPTRAESSDVANAVFDNADCVMLSGESAFGKYPRESVSEMAKIVRAAEKSFFNNVPLLKAKMPREAENAVELARKNKIPVVLVTETGESARVISNFRQESPVFAYCPNEEILRKLTLVWGIHPLFPESPDPVAGIKQVVFVQTKKESKTEKIASVALKNL